MLTGHGSIEAAVEATKRGAYYFQQKPIDGSTLKLQVERALEHKQINEENSALRRALSTMSGGAAPVFQSQSMKQVVRTIERVAPSDVSILITGESGTGKEVIADLIHLLSPRSKGPNIKVNCAALAARIDRERTVRLRQRRVHRRAGRSRRTLPPGRRRHAVARRTFRNAHRHAKQTAPRVAGKGSAARRRQDQLQDQLPHHRRDEPQAGGRDQGRQAARGFVITASARFRFTCRRCASAAKTSCRWPTPF